MRWFIQTILLHESHVNVHEWSSVGISTQQAHEFQLMDFSQDDENAALGMLADIL
jgi:S-adenosylmethionine/arginine decarboxylase-like enzyme